MIIKSEAIVHDGEEELEDNYPVFGGYMYLAEDGQVIWNHYLIHGTIGQLKVAVQKHEGIKVQVLRRCDITARKLQKYMV